MYTVDDQDRVTELKDIPQSSIGAPLPLIFSSEMSTIVSFYTEGAPDDFDGSSIRIVEMESSDEVVAIVRFKFFMATMFGPPNDEAFTGHPLASRGLRPYGAFVIENSSWLRGLARMNSVHPYHSSRQFEEYKHYVLSFHDSTFECIARGYEWEIHAGSMNDQIARMITKLSTSHESDEL